MGLVGVGTTRVIVPLPLRASFAAPAPVAM